MCFKNLPIEFDAQGNATLKPGAANPYAYTETPLPTPIEDDPAKMKELFARNGAIRRVDFDPVTRVAGALAFHTVHRARRDPDRPRATGAPAPAVRGRRGGPTALARACGTNLRRLAEPAVGGATRDT